MELTLYVCKLNEEYSRLWRKVNTPALLAAEMFALIRRSPDLKLWAVARNGVLLAWSKDAPLDAGGLMARVRG